MHDAELKYVFNSDFMSDSQDDINIDVNNFIVVEKRKTERLLIFHV